MSPAIEAAFCSAVRVTLHGSSTPICDQVAVLAGRRVVAEVARRPSTTRSSTTDGSSPALATICRSGSSSARSTILMPAVLVGVGAVQLAERGARAQQRHAAAGQHAFLDRRARRVQRVLDARLALLHLGLGRGADLHDRHAARELRGALLQLLLVVVAGRCP